MTTGAVPPGAAPGRHRAQVCWIGVSFALEVLSILTEASSGVNVNNAYTQRDILRAVRDELEVMAGVIDRTITEVQPA